MHRLTTVLITLLVPVFPGFAQEAPAPLNILDVAEAPVMLEDLQWISRPLVIFADSPADPRFAEQLALLAADPAVLEDRDVVVITDTSPGDRSEVRKALRPRGFMLVLLSKDGSVVFRKPLPWDLREITHAIDKLPLRKQEVINQRAATN